MGVHGTTCDEAFFDESKLRKAIEYCLDKHKFTLSYLISVIDISKNYKNHRIQLFFTDDEWKTLTERSNHKKMADWARSFLLK